MVTTATPYTLDRNRAGAGHGSDGVARIVANGYYGTGALLSDGRTLLTSAHLFSQGTSDASVIFETSGGTTTMKVESIVRHPAYDPVDENNDLALVRLNGSAPLDADRYPLYRQDDEIGHSFTMVGYGVPGTGLTGFDSRYTGSALRLKASNTFDAEAAALKLGLGTALGWSPLAGSQLIADFDNGTFTHDALGRLIARPGVGLGVDEGLLSPGDSGGPAFLDGKVAGIASYTASLSLGAAAPDIDAVNNSSFGEIAAWQRVSAYQQWIDQNLRIRYPDAPTQPQEVHTSVAEGNAGVTYAYFLLRFTGVRSHPDDILSVDYATRNGTALAGVDYIATNGRLNLYPDETQAVVPVEIIGDTAPEGNETFYLDVTNPVGGSFGENMVQLTAIRTIVDDDGWI